MSVSFKNLTKNTKLSETQFYSVEQIKGDKVQLKNDFGEFIVVDKPYVEKLLVASDQFEEVKKMSRTDLINLFLASPNVICQVNFNKKVDEKEVKKELINLYPNTGGKIASKTDFEKAVNKAIKGMLVGEERTMVGRHMGKVDEFGRIKFIDMEAPGGYDEAKGTDSRQRVIDPRTLNWLILRGVRYEAQ